MYNHKANEQSTLNTVDFYGMLKAEQERMILRTCLQDLTTIVRLGTIYGFSPRMRYDLVINQFIAQGLCWNTINVFCGEQVRPFVHINDVCRAVCRLIFNNFI